MQVYPLFAAMGFAVGICGYQLVRNICINPDVRCVSLSQFFFFFFFRFSNLIVVMVYGYFVYGNRGLRF